MTKLAELMAEVQRHPLDDAPRTVVADALEQGGDVDRAQLIHLQLKRSALAPWDVRAVELELAERAILRRRDADWRAALPNIAGVTSGSFARGFISKVAFDKAELLATNLDACLAATPIHSVVMRWPRKAKLDRIDGLVELTVVGTAMASDDLKSLAKSPILSTVRALNLVDSELRDGLPSLIKSPHLTQLEALRVPANQIGDGGIAKLVAAMKSLTELDLSVTSETERDHGSGRESSRVRIAGDRGAESLASWSGLPSLRSLDLSGWELGRGGLTKLLDSPYARGLRSLRLRDIADAEWEVDDSLAAFEVGPASRLDTLDIGDNDLDADAAGAIGSGALAELAVLRIDGVRSKHFERLAQARWIHTLQVIIADEAALIPIVRAAPNKLHTIEVTARSGSLAFIAHLKKLPALAVLDLSRVQVDDGTIRQLAALDLPSIKAIRLKPRGRTKLTYTRPAVSELASSALGRRLVSLDAGFPQLDKLPPMPPIAYGDGEYDGPCRYL